MNHEYVEGWEFLDDQGTFRLKNPHHTSYLYFPLVNEAGMMACVTPTLHGDIKSGQNTFLTRPVSVEDLHDSRSARNFWVHIAGEGPWSVTGNSAAQLASRFSESAERVTLEAGLLWHTLIRENLRLGLRATITNFVPAGEDQVELMQVTITNTGSKPRQMIPFAAIPIYARSADNLRDHRHVSSLFHRIRCHRYGVLTRPTLSFDERGHTPNDITYAVLGADEGGAPPAGFYPVTKDFIGEGGNLDWPEAVVRPLEHLPVDEGSTFEGYEAMGGLQFQDIDLNPGESMTFILILGILSGGNLPEQLVETYGSGPKFRHWLEKTRHAWRTRQNFSVQTGHTDFDGWMKWVAVQPTLRRLFGNSFLPYHDYGRGGRGWRDLWQDILALLIQGTTDVSDHMLEYLAGVRMDGSNATIIGSKPGEFKADRNDIPRVWMDHGAWPMLTTKLYLDLTGNLGFLLRRQNYFKDHLVHRAKKIDETWRPEQGIRLRNEDGKVYLGTVLEHLLVQNLVSFFNVGEHNITLLEGADWNDGLDMASERGESVAFTALYSGNLQTLSELVLALRSLNIDTVDLATEILLLLDTLSNPVDYASVNAKRARLEAYFSQSQPTISGEVISVPLQELAGDLAKKAAWLGDHIHHHEWIHNDEGFSWFNGYYDNDGHPIEGDHPLGVRMTLTGQVFPLLSGVASDEQAHEIVRAANRYLFDPWVGGYRLNTDFGETLLNLGRASGFAFGHKENGAMFSHMAMMFANALYRRGLPREGYKVLDRSFRASVDFPISRMYPGIPEYFDPQGRGVYPYLTGSASWYLFTMVTEVFGIRGHLGDLVLSPKLMREQFDRQGIASVRTMFAERCFEITFHNSDQLDWDEYQIKGIKIDGESTSFDQVGTGAILTRQRILELSSDQIHLIDVALLRRK